MIGLLRAVNVGGATTLPMADLRTLLIELGYAHPTTLLQSGNVVFGSAGRGARETAARTERRIADALALRWSRTIDVFVRTASEWSTAIEANPFPDEAASDPAHLLLMALKDAPTPAAVRALQGAIVGREVVQAIGRHLYLVYPDGVGRSKLTLALIERMLATRGTARNWNTVLKLAALVAAPVEA